MPSRRDWLHKNSAGLSLVEVLLSLLITLVVMGLVMQTSRNLAALYRNQSRSVETSAAITRAFADIIDEVARAGHGIGEGRDLVLASIPGRPSSSETITLRSNPEGVAVALTSEITEENEVPVTSTERFEPGNVVLVTDSSGIAEPAEITAKTGTSLWLRSLESPDGQILSQPSTRRGARVIKLREVRFFLQPDRDGNVLLKQVVGAGGNTRILARRVETLRFDYQDGSGNKIAPASLNDSRDGRLVVKITLRASMGTERDEATTLATAVALDVQSTSVDFAEQGYGFRLARIFHPIEHAAGVTGREFTDWGVIVSAGQNPTRDRSYLYTYLLREQFLDTRVDNVIWLDDVRDPVALAFGPEKSPLAGSLFVASSGLRIGHLTRIHPDEHGTLSAESELTTFEQTESLAQIGGMVFGVDEALYIAGSEKATLFRYRFDAGGQPEGPEVLAKLNGTPSSMVRGTDGSLYFLLEQSSGSSIWKIGFDEFLSPGEPVEVGPLPGQGLSLAVDPESGNLFALVGERSGDTTIVELSRYWLANPVGEANRIFSLNEFRDKTVRLSSTLLPEQLDFVAFDDYGLLYVGATEQDLVLKFDLGRPDARHEVEIAGVALERTGAAEGTLPDVKLHAWRKRPFR